MDSKLANIVFVSMFFLAGAFFISKGVLKRPPQPPPVITSPEQLTMTQEVRDYIDSHCNSQKSTDAALTAKITELENKLAELKRVGDQSKDIEAKIDEFRSNFQTLKMSREERMKKQRKAEFLELQDTILDSCRPEGRKGSSSQDSSDSK